MFKRIDHVEITTADPGKTLAFYTDVIGFKIGSRNKMDRPPLEEILFLTLGDTTLEILAVKEAAPVSAAAWQTGYRMMALEVDDMDQAIAYLRSRGIEPSRLPMGTGKTRRAEIRDPNGIPIELRQW